MSLSAAILVALAGVAAGAINAVVGSGTLVTFPTLLAVGLPPVAANISNNVGLVPGGAAGVWGYRRELAGQRRVVRRLVPMSLLGGTAGAVLLLVLPESAFAAIVPALIALSLVLVVAGPSLQRGIAARRAEDGVPTPDRARWVMIMVSTFLAGAYGGYFGGAQGILLLGLLGALLGDELHRLNALKNVLATAVNGLAALVFVAVASGRIHWVSAALVAAGSVVGGLVGSRYGRHLPPAVLRALIVVIGVVAIVRMLAR